MSAEATVQTIIDNALATANQKNALVDAWANASWITYTVRPPETSSIGFDGIKFNGDVREAELSSISGGLVNGTETLPELQFPNEIVIPRFSTYGQVVGGVPQDDPIVQIISELNDYSVDYGLDTIGPKLQELFESFITAYFPAFLPPEMGVSNIETILSNQGHTISVPDENAVYQRARDRVMAERLREEEDHVALFASRGFPLPNGMLLSRMDKTRKDANDKIGQITSDIVVKQADLAADMYKFAITQAMDYRMKSVNAAVEYIKVFTTSIMRQFGADSYAAILNARNNMYGTSIDLYKTMQNIRELRTRLAAGDRNLTADAWKSAIGVDAELVRSRAASAIGAANAVSHVAAAAMSSVNTMSNLANITNN